MTLEAILLLLSGHATGNLLNQKFQSPFMDPGGGTLIFGLIGFIGFIVYYFVAANKTTPVAARRGFIVAAVCVLTMIVTLSARQIRVRNENSDILIANNDGVVQTEEAAKFLLHGTNPYRADFSQSQFKSFPNPAGADLENVAMTHFAYPPLIFLLVTPMVWLNQHAGLDIDIQLWYMAVFLIYAALLMLVSQNWRTRTRLLLLTAGNPFIWMFAMAGFNDFVWVTLVVAAALATVNKKWLWAGISLGLALAAKQTAWIVLPLWLWWLWRQTKNDPTDRIKIKQAVIATTVTAGVIILPFFLWSPYDFYTDTIKYVSGQIPFSYPISGWTLMQYVRVFGLVESPWTKLMTWPIQAVVAVPLLWSGLKMITQKPQARSWLAASTILLLGITLFNRFAPDNYYIAVFCLAIAAYAFHTTEKDKPKGLADTSEK